MLRKLLAGMTFAFAATVAPAHAAPSPLITGVVADGYFDNSGLTLGYVIEFASDVNVVSLGYVDVDGEATPLRESHDVGVWDAAGTLLGSVTIAPSDPFRGGYRYGTLPTSLVLNAGQYVLGAFTGDESLAAGTGGDDEPFSASLAGAITSSEATILAGDCCGFLPGFPFAFSNGLFVDGPSLAFPGIGYEQFNWVANLEYLTARVPEPATWVLLCTAAALAWRGRRHECRRAERELQICRRDSLATETREDK